MNRLVLLALTGALSLAANASSTMAHPGDEPTGRTYEPWWIEKVERLDAVVREQGSGANVLFIGDSITEGWAREGREIWQEHFVRCGALNLGVGSDQTAHVLWRLDHMDRELLRPKIIVVMIGTNNIPYIPGQGQTISQVSEGVGAVVRRLENYFPESKILLMGIFPRGSNPDRMRGEVYQINQLISRYADGQRIEWLDIADEFVADDGTIPLSLMYDGLHLTEAGYRIWAEAIDERLNVANACE